MKRNLTMKILLVVASSLSASAVEWEELEWSANVVSDYKTGLPAIIFSTGLAYDERPETMKLSIAWEYFEWMVARRRCSMSIRELQPLEPSIPISHQRRY